MDEAICPMDYKSAGVLVDDDLHAILVANIPPGVRLTAILVLLLFIFYLFIFRDLKF